MELSPEQRRLLPTDDEVRFYREHGYYISRPIFSDEEIDDAMYGSECFYAGERDFSLHASIKPFEGWTAEDGDVMRINDYVSLQNREISALVRHPLLGAVAARLCGSPVVRLWHDQMIHKPVDKDGTKTGIGWHTDRAYWKTCDSDSMLTAWIPFGDCDESMGPLVVVDGSHAWPGNGELKGFHSSDLESLERKMETGGRQVVKVPMTLKKGQVSFHHCLTLHGSGANRGEGPRRSLSVHLQDGANRYREHRDARGEVVWHRNDMLCRVLNGQPDYADPDICPLLWTDET